MQQIAADGDYEGRPGGRRVAVTQADACLVTGVADLVRSAIENVVRNAIRYAPAGTTVTIAVARSDGSPPATAHVTVRDHGPGIPQTLLPEIFQPFRRGHGVPGEPTPGAGLGLAIADRVMQMHGGRIGASNCLPRGLEVEMVLPLSGHDDARP